MADTSRITSLSILTETGEGNAYLAETYGGGLQSEFSENISKHFVNTNLSGNPSAGTVIVRRVAKTTGNTIGSARAAGAGEKLKVQEIVIPLDESWEFINEVNEADTLTFGVPGLVQMKAADNVQDAAKKVETGFWVEAVNAGTKVETTADTMAKKVDAAIVAVETTKNDFVRGTSRANLGVVLSPAAYSELQGDIDKIPNLNTGNTYEYFHNVPVYCSTDLPDGIEVVVLAKQSIAQPILPLTPPAGRVPFSNDFFFGTTGKYKNKAVAPELIKYIGEATAATSEEEA